MIKLLSKLENILHDSEFNKIRIKVRKHRIFTMNEVKSIKLNDNKLIVYDKNKNPINFPNMPRSFTLKNFDLETEIIMIIKDISNLKQNLESADLEHIKCISGKNIFKYPEYYKGIRSYYKEVYHYAPYASQRSICALLYNDSLKLCNCYVVAIDDKDNANLFYTYDEHLAIHKYIQEANNILFAKNIDENSIMNVLNRAFSYSGNHPTMMDSMIASTKIDLNYTNGKKISYTDTCPQELYDSLEKFARHIMDNKIEKYNDTITIINFYHNEWPVSLININERLINCLHVKLQNEKLFNDNKYEAWNNFVIEKNENNAMIYFYDEDYSKFDDFINYIIINHIKF